MLVSGAYLTLLIGPSVPLPAPMPVMEALKSVQVNTSGDRTGFQLTFTVGKTSLIQLALLPSGYFDPIITRVIVVVTLNGIPNVLVDGFVTRQEMQPASEPGQSTLTITGEDLTVAMDLVQLTLSLPGRRRTGQSDPGQVCVSRHHSRRRPAVHLHGQDTARRLDHADRDRPSAHPRPGQPERVRVLHRTGAAARPEHCLFRPRHPRSVAAASPERQHGRPHKRRVAQLQPRRPAEAAR